MLYGNDFMTISCSLFSRCLSQGFILFLYPNVLCICSPQLDHALFRSSEAVLYRIRPQYPVLSVLTGSTSRAKVFHVTCHLRTFQLEMTSTELWPLSIHTIRLLIHLAYCCFWQWLFMVSDVTLPYRESEHCSIVCSDWQWLSLSCKVLSQDWRLNLGHSACKACAVH